MKSISVILFLLTLLSAVYLLASPHRQSVAGDVIQSEAYHEQAGEYRRGWPFPYLTYKAEHGDSKTTYYDFSYTYQPCLLYTSPSPRDQRGSRMPSSA